MINPNYSIVFADFDFDAVSILFTNIAISSLHSEIIPLSFSSDLYILAFKRILKQLCDSLNSFRQTFILCRKSFFDSALLASP